jgi:acetyl-CoA carboxylase carboxyl transferase subunit beta
MSLLDWFAQKKKTSPEVAIQKDRLKLSPELWMKCPNCNEVVYKKTLEENLNVCPGCGFHFRINFSTRLELLSEPDSFSPLEEQISPKDFLNFTDSQKYDERLGEAQNKTGLRDAVITGTARIGQHQVGLGIMDFNFMGGSMGSVVGEKVTRLIEKCATEKIPLVIVCATGGARMQEGIISLMQMAKTASALAHLDEAKIPYLAIFSDPTTAGVLASYGMLADIIVAEPGTLIGFAGPRVIEQTIRQKLPKGFQRAEYLLEHGMIDLVVPRKNLKETVVTILDWFAGK